MLNEQRIASILVRKQRQVAHKSPEAQASYLRRQEAILRAEWAAQMEREFVNACGFHSDGSPTLGQRAGGKA